MGALEEELGEHLRSAMRAGDLVRRDTIRQLRAALHNEAIALGRSLNDAEAAAVVRRLVSQHRDSISEFTRGGRQDLVEREEAELAVLLEYQPEEMGREEIMAVAAAVIQSVGAQGRQDLGKVMRELSAQLRGRADMRLVNEVVQGLLS